MPVLLRLPYRQPIDVEGLIAFLGQRAVAGVEEVLDGAYRRSLRLPRGPGVVELGPGRGCVHASLWLHDTRDLAVAAARCRTLLDLDADPQAVIEALGTDPVIGRLVRAAPGRRVPGHVDGDELALRAVLGQQISVPAATTLAARLVAAHGQPLERPVDGITHLFPTAAAIAGVDPAALAMPGARARALIGLAGALARGEVRLDPGADRAEAERALLALPGIGPWTVAYVAMRALGDADAFLPTDLGVRRGLEALGHDGRPVVTAAIAERWRPYRAYAVQHLWAQAAGPDRTATAPARDTSHNQGHGPHHHHDPHHHGHGPGPKPTAGGPLAMVYCTLESPIGELLLTGEGDALRALHMQEGRWPTSIRPGWTQSDEPFARVRTQLREYFEGRRRSFDVPLEPTGSSFELAVWTALREIPYGETVSYGELAARIGRPEAARAVGVANARNPIAVIVPCHRVIGADGSLTGYGGGLERKRLLLDLEAGVLALPV